MRVQIGIDENGLGSQLGPMVVTAVRLEIDPARVTDESVFRAAAERAGIGDSKAACAHGSMGAVEARVQAILARHLGLGDARALATLEALTHALALDDAPTLRRACPPGEAPRACFADSLPLPAFGAGPARGDHDAADALLDAGVRLAGVRVGLACARWLNEGKAQGRSRFDLDLALMVRLAGALARAGDVATPATALTALCGKVGGRKSYGAALEPLAPLVMVLGETPARSSYRVPGFGEIHFVMDGDATEPAIGLASLVGKYVRELWMHRLNRYWLDAVPGAEPASGYHDPVTQRLVAATALVRKEREIPDDCFAR